MKYITSYILNLKSNRAGMTLIELLMVVSLIIALSSFSAPFFARFLNQNSVENATQQLIGDFHKAQMYAISGKQNDNWGVHYFPGTITMYKGTSFAARNAAFDERFSVPTAVTVSGFTEINFSRATGVPFSGNPSTTPTIIISATGNNTNTITINAQGVASR